ncbi:MAG: hypothetical protein HY935_04285 [Nitrosomonadales bacterium]|nr:hypothetical protein [Nitrosomonadales bacterium]
MAIQLRFMCDEMLGRLCRYLRATGYDALFANNGHSDSILLRQCREEGRYFLTCGSVYWRGAHYKRMRAKLVAW